MATEINPLNDRQVSRLRKSITASRQKLAPFRQHRLDFIRQYVGFRYAEKGCGSEEKVPINLLSLAVRIYQRHLSARAPTVLVGTPHMELKPSASLFELAINHLIRQIRLGSVLRNAVLDAIMSMGIVKIGLAMTGQVNIDGTLHHTGEPFADVVNLDDWVHDCSAKSYEQAEYAGNRYKIPLDLAKESEFFNKAARDKLTATEQNAMSDPGGENDKAEDISKGKSGYWRDEDDWSEKVELWDIFLPREQLIVTMPCDEGPVLKVAEWQGLEAGPFRILSFGEVPGNQMPKSPVQDLFEIHDLTNRVFRKVARQAERQKTWYAAGPGAESDGQRTVDANDGEVLRMDNPKNIQEVRHGGADPASLAFSIQLQDIFSRMAGNLDTLGGLSPQADTAAQEKLLAGSASKLVSDMQDRTMDFTHDVIADLGWYLWYDPLIDLPLIKRVADREIPVRFNESEKRGDFLDYNITIQPYSMQERSPTARMQTIMQVFQNFIAPFAGMMQQQGIGVNFDGLLRIIAGYSDMDELEEILTFMAQPQGVPKPGPVGEMPNKSPVTNRTYTRVSRVGATQGGKNSALIQTLMGGNPQEKEMAGLSRPVA